MKQKFIEWFTKNNNGCSPAMEDDRSFVYEMTQNMFEAYQAGVAEGEARCAALAAENAGLKSAFDKPDAWLSWHSIPPTFYEPDRGGEYLQVHEKAGEKNDDGSDSWPVYRKPETETPATDAFLAEVRASGVEMYADNLDSSADDAERDGFDDAVKFLRSESSGVRLFAAQIRKGVQS
ncbi:hypothetical protein ACOY6D_06405 [Enterobacter hormaechei]|uniref:hypothetical protein n=1 Tax=Enterobacter hormaechei TaxID=158836 RepID=UPI002018203A|nr:hypothetical protein [Enterobacter hormaechei]